MPRRESPIQSEMVQGTLDMLILRTLVLGPAHGQTVPTRLSADRRTCFKSNTVSYIPARRAAAVDPVETLRGE